jgi:hypothetical protein
VVVAHKLHKDVLAWEVKFTSDFNIDVTSLEFELQDGTLFRDIQTRFENHDIELKEKILSYLDLNIIREKIPTYKEIDIKIFKDIPGFKLYPHLDRFEHKGFIMINLINNVNSTAFYDLQDKFIVEASNNKNKGVFHLLHTGRPYVQHAIENTSNKDRYTTIAFIK